MSNVNAWIGVDLDGTLATGCGLHGGIETIGYPVASMVARVREWIQKGVTVKIVTARMSFPAGESREYQRRLIAVWTKKQFGIELEATASKDFDMLQLWDDRAVTVERNTGCVLTNMDAL